MNHSSHRHLALALGILLLAAGSSHALTIFFKDGSKEMVAQSYRVEGKFVIALLESGQETSIPLEAVDLEKTESNSKATKGSGIVIDRSIEGTDSTPAQRAKSVRDLLRERSTLPTPVPLFKTVSRSDRRTPAGNVDLLNLPRQKVGSAARAEAVQSLLRRHGLADATAYQGTSSNRVLIDIVTANRGDVFKALQSCAAVLLELRASSQEIEALELAMATATRSRAGQFVLTPEQAESLSSGAVTPAEHFVANVLF